MTAELDRLDLELRSIPGVVAVGLDQDASGFVVQVVILRSLATHDIRDRVRRSITANVRDPVNLEVVIDTVASAS